jgi:hypothetical protein
MPLHMEAASSNAISLSVSPVAITMQQRPERDWLDENSNFSRICPKLLDSCHQIFSWTSLLTSFPPSTFTPPILFLRMYFEKTETLSIENAKMV